MIGKCSKGNNLVSAAGVLEEAGVEAVAAAEEVVDLPGLDVVGDAGDEEGVNVGILGGDHGRHGRMRRRSVGVRVRVVVVRRRLVVVVHWERLLGG